MMPERKTWNKITVQRTLILEYLQQAKDHPSARKVFVEVRKKLPRLSLSTVYRTLAELKKQNLVREIVVEGESRYETNFQDHLDFYCLRCRRVIDIPKVEILELKRRLTEEGFEVRESFFLAKGICPHCQRFFRGSPSGKKRSVI